MNRRHPDSSPYLFLPFDAVDRVLGFLVEAFVFLAVSVLFFSSVSEPLFAARRARFGVSFFGSGSVDVEAPNFALSFSATRLVRRVAEDFLGALVFGFAFGDALSSLIEPRL